MVMNLWAGWPVFATGIMGGGVGLVLVLLAVMAWALMDEVGIREMFSREKVHRPASLTCGCLRCAAKVRERNDAAG